MKRRGGRKSSVFFLPIIVVHSAHDCSCIMLL